MNTHTSSYSYTGGGRAAGHMHASKKRSGYWSYACKWEEEWLLVSSTKKEYYFPANTAGKSTQCTCHLLLLFAFSKFFHFLLWAWLHNAKGEQLPVVYKLCGCREQLPKS